MTKAQIGAGQGIGEIRNRCVMIARFRSAAGSGMAKSGATEGAKLRVDTVWPRSRDDAAALRGPFLGVSYFQIGCVQASLSAWIVELVIALAYYHMTPLRSLEASLWGNLSMWTGFLVLYTGQLFGQAYRNTGLLEILLESVQSMLPSWDQEGRAVALVTLGRRLHRRVQRLCHLSGDDSRSGGAGLSTGFPRARATWSIFRGRCPSTACFIAPKISNAASHVPVVDIVRVPVCLAFRWCSLSLLGFLKILGFRFLGVGDAGPILDDGTGRT